MPEFLLSSLVDKRISKYLVTQVVGLLGWGISQSKALLYNPMEREEKNILRRDSNLQFKRVGYVKP
jgi:hypothetical protein